MPTEISPFQTGARDAPFREDLDHAARCLRPVQRRGRGALDHLDALDVLRRDVLDRRDRHARRAAQTDRQVVHAYAVDVDQRFRRLRRGRLPADADRAARARLPARLPHGHARHAAAQDLFRVLDRDVLDVARGHRIHRVAHLAQASLHGRSGHHDLLQRHGGLLQREIHRSRRARGHRHRPGFRAVPDELDAYAMAASRHARDQVPPVRLGQYAEAQTLDHDLCTGDRPTRVLRDDPPADLARGLSGRSRREGQDHDRTGNPPCDPIRCPWRHTPPPQV